MGMRVEVELRGRWLGERSVGASALIGRSRSADLVLPHPTVALRHARLEIRRGRMVIVDLGASPRGTVVQGRRIDAPVVAATGPVRLTLGEVGLRARLSSEAPRRTPDRVRLDRLLELEASGCMGFPPEVRVGLAARGLWIDPNGSLSPDRIWLTVGDGRAEADALVKDGARGTHRPLLAALGMRGLDGFEDLDLDQVTADELLFRAGRVGLDPGSLAVVRVLRVAHALGAG